MMAMSQEHTKRGRKVTTTPITANDLVERAAAMAQIPHVLDPEEGTPKPVQGQEAAAAQVVATVALVKAVLELTEEIRSRRG